MRLAETIDQARNGSGYCIVAVLQYWTLSYHESCTMTNILHRKKCQKWAVPYTKHVLKLIIFLKVSWWWSLGYIGILATFNDYSSLIDDQHDDDDIDNDDNIDAEGVGALLGSWLPFLRTA